MLGVEGVKLDGEPMGVCAALASRARGRLVGYPYVGKGKKGKGKGKGDGKGMGMGKGSSSDR